MIFNKLFCNNKKISYSICKRSWYNEPIFKSFKKTRVFWKFNNLKYKNSNAIEGNTLSYAETYSIVFNDESLPLQNVNPRELYEAINLKYALKYSLDNLNKFDKNLIISIGDLINKNIKDTSGFRKIQNYIEQLLKRLVVNRTGWNSKHSSVRFLRKCYGLRLLCKHHKNQHTSGILAWNKEKIKDLS